MTRKEFFMAITTKEGLDDNLRQFAKKELERLNKPTKKQLENEDIKTEILEIIKSVKKELTATKIQNILATKNKDFNVQKITSLCRQLVDEGKIEKTIDTKDIQRAYKIMEVE